MSQKLSQRAHVHLLFQMQNTDLQTLLLIVQEIKCSKIIDLHALFLLPEKLLTDIICMLHVVFYYVLV